MENQSENKNVVSPWSFRDGKEYIVSVSVNEKPRSLGILISDKITAEEWSCHYDLKYIEDLTQRTGNYKPFDTFVTMIKCAILKNSDAVAIDLMTYEDLKFIKSKRHREGIVISNEYPAYLLNTGNSAESGNQQTSSESSLSKRKYLIVTYVAEFDNVHYPIPLHYSGPPDPLVMQNNIKKLQAEVNLLKNTNSELRGKLSVRQFEGRPRGNENVGTSAAEIFVRASSRTNYPQRRGSGRSRQDIRESQKNPNIVFEPPENRIEPHQVSVMDMEQMGKLLSSIHRLEMKIVTERSEHLDQMEKLQSENGYLRDRINELKVSEQSLNLQISRLEKMFEMQSAVPSRKPSRLTNNKKILSPKKNLPTKPLSRQKSPYLPARGNPGLPPLKSAPPGQSAHGPYYDHSRSRAPSTEFLPGRRRRLLPNREATTKPRSRTASPTPYFDPTSYVREKQLRQEEINRLRYQQIKVNFLKLGKLPNSADASSESRERGRSVSFGRNTSMIENASGYSTPAATDASLAGSKRISIVAQRHYNLTHRSTSRSPPRNTELRLAQRKLKAQEQQHTGPISRGRSIERRTSSRTVAGKREKEAFKIRIDGTNINSDDGVSSMENSEKNSKTDSVTWMTEDERNKLFQFTRPREDQEHSEKFLLKDFEGSLDALQAFVNITNQGFNGLR